jgi:hypothetical protein
MNAKVLAALHKVVQWKQEAALFPDGKYYMTPNDGDDSEICYWWKGMGPLDTQVIVRAAYCRGRYALADEILAIMRKTVSG